MPVSGLHRQLATIALGAAARYGFALAGGNALIAHGVVNRFTADVDLFTDEEAGVAVAAEAVEAALAAARDFSRWIQIAAKPVRARTSGQDDQVLSQSAGTVGKPPGMANPVTGKPAPALTYAPTTVLHCETVLRSFYEYHLQAGTGADRQPVPAGAAR
jgi:Nucleotidyl transferase AbiEii toxin, Type IV TA system